MAQAVQRIPARRGMALQRIQALVALTIGATAFQAPPRARFETPPHPRPSTLLRATLEAPSSTSTLRPDIAECLGNEPEGLFDESEKIQAAPFPLSETELIGLAKAYIASFTNGDGVDWYARDFRFVAPVVGPFDKDLFVDSLSGFDLQKAFPDLNSNAHHFRVDPFETNRVWWSVKYTGKNTGPVLGRPATGKTVESPIQAQSATFNEKDEVTKFTIGYVLDKETGNTGGLGGVFGLFYAIGYGLPFPEAQPWRPSPLYGTLMSGNRAIQSFFKEQPSVKDAVLSTISALGGGAK